MEDTKEKEFNEHPGENWQELFRDERSVTFWRRAGTEVAYNPTYDVTSKFPVYQIIKRPYKPSP